MTGEHRAETPRACLRRLRRRALADRLRLYATRPPRRRTLRDLAVEAVVALVVAMALVVGLVLMSGRDAPAPPAGHGQGRSDERLHDRVQTMTDHFRAVATADVVADGALATADVVADGALLGSVVAWCGGAR